ncbi:MAG: hypothetical protein HYY76_08390 [Acidobacteria bacterium]|nr:hypothetical protein [Acidobacteriota bacterium]
MNRLLVLFLVGVAFGAVARILRVTGVLVDDGPYSGAFAFGLGVVTGIVAMFAAAYVKDHHTTLHPRF